MITEYSIDMVGIGKAVDMSVIQCSNNITTTNTFPQFCPTGNICFEYMAERMIICYISI